MAVALIGNIKPDDDFPHAVEAASNFSESCLFHYAGYDQQGRLLGGLIRVANRPNEGFAECSVLVWLPDGSALFNFERPKKDKNDGWAVSGWNIRVLEAGGVRFQTSYEGSVLFLENPRVMADPKVGYKQPRLGLKFDLQFSGKGPMTEFAHHRPLDDPRERDRYGTSGIQQLMRASGTIEIEGRTKLRFDGFGWRDHNWGPRNWQGFTNHAFLTGNLNAEEGFSLYSTLDGHGYYFHRGPSQIVKVSELKIETEFGNDREPLSLAAHVQLENGERHVITGRQKGYMPLRNRREGLITTIGYSLWEYACDGKGGGVGQGEFLSQNWANDEVKYYSERSPDKAGERS